MTSESHGSDLCEQLAVGGRPLDTLFMLLNVTTNSNKLQLGGCGGVVSPGLCKFSHLKKDDKGL